MAIKKANELNFSNKKIALLIYGRPGIGKTTVALSAKKPLLLDLENGVDRVEACYRKDTSIVEDYNSVDDAQKYDMFLNDLKNEDLSEYDTIVVDTLGKLIELITPVVIKENPVNGLSDGKTLSLKGYGAVGKKVKEFIKTIKDLNKHLIIVAHSTESQDGNEVKYRIAASGSTKESIWDDLDLGCFMSFLGKERVLYFTPTSQYDAKGTHGIKGSYSIPELKDQANGGKVEDNHLIGDLFDAYLGNIINSTNNYNSDREVYNEAMKNAQNIKECQEIDTLNDIVDVIKTTKHALTSREELLSMVQYKASELGAVYDKQAKCYVPKAKETAN